ncbi:MAG: sporulation integral membrane protein YtvI [Clostridia bacterium]|nr:sporulation integral membrane protein YtvI [Clostridia bacterium]
MQDERKRIYFRLLVEVVTAVVAAAALALLGGPAFSILMPFILAFIMAWAFNPVIQILQKHLRMTRKLFSYILVLVFYTVLFFLCLMFARQVISQVIGLAGSVPTIIAQLQSVYNRLVIYVQELLTLLPPEYADVEAEVLALLSSAWEWLRSLITRVLSSAVGITSGVAMEVPSFVIFLTVLVLASCIITADFPNLRENIYSYLGSKGKQSLRLMGHSFRTAVLGFFRSQLIFALVDMAIILAAFFIIGVPYPLPIALVLCFLDFIPFFGAGTVLVPWGAVCIVLGAVTMGAQLLLLYAILYIIRRIFEPRVLGGATGFSSLQMLFSMYAGMQLYGVTGLIVAPILWITAVNFLKTGILNGVFADIRFVVSDVRTMIARPEPTKTTEPPSARTEDSAPRRFLFFRREKPGKEPPSGKS